MNLDFARDQFSHQQNRFAQEFGEAQRQYDTNNLREDNFIQRRVSDAQSAGIHPLYALGAGGGGGGGGFQPAGGGSVSAPMMAGQSQTGSGLSTGIASAGRAIGRAVSDMERARTPEAKRAERMKEAQIALATSQTLRNNSDATLMDINSQMKRAEMEANMVRTSPDWSSGSATYPLGTRAGPALNMRPLNAMPRQSIPTLVEMVGPKGRRMILNPESGLDEVSQMRYITSPYAEWLKSRYSRKYMPKSSSPAYKYWQKARRKYAR